ncbi:SURF1-domain-containing protein [Plenodomus tracheiphilus IPT5]|uniref:SURF1-like protein n=1 Tax=Plenodomus tracheiphilus IPT5 TaxID=1408161 RepID=A0A6A7BM73_9PLEO|nr:SURF1-domain-containing protein [Plenodomus tracheiphilus IPT5]
MSKPNPFLTLFRRHYTYHASQFTRSTTSPIRSQCLRARFQQRQNPQRRSVGGGPGLDPNFVSILDRPAKMARVGKQHGWGLIILATIPVTAFILGCWQVQRLGWKTELVARFEDRLTFPPLELPLRIDPEVVKDFDYRRVYATGVLRHDQEMLIGPRMLDGEEGYTVVTPLERKDSKGNVHKILCCRGWIKKDTAAQWFRKQSGALPEGEVTVEGLIRIPPKGNMFTPRNEPEKGKWFSPSVEEMAEWSGSQPVWVEETMIPDLLTNYEREPKGVPIGRAPTVNLRNNHTQYIFTWYALSFATSIMFWMVVKKPISGTQRRVRHSVDWS